MDTEWMQAWFVSSPIGRSVGVIIEKREEAMRAKYNRLSREAIDSPIYSSRDGTIIFNGNVPIWRAITSVTRAFALTRLRETLALAQGMTCTSVIFSPPVLSRGCKFVAPSRRAFVYKSTPGLNLSPLLSRDTRLGQSFIYVTFLASFCSSAHLRESRECCFTIWTDTKKLKLSLALFEKEYVTDTSNCRQVQFRRV